MADSKRRDLIEHLKRALSKGYKQDSLRWALLGQGYPDTIIDRAMEQAVSELSAEAKEKFEKEKPKIKVEVFDEHNKPVKLKTPFWKRIFGKD